MNIAHYLLRILLQLTSFRYIYIFLSSPVLSYRYHEGVWGGANSSLFYRFIQYYRKPEKNQDNEIYLNTTLK